MKTNWKWSTFWAVIAVCIAIGESVAAFNGGAGDTLSEQVWAILDLGQSVWLAGLGAFVGGFGILVWHFFFDKQNTGR